MRLWASPSIEAECWHKLLHKVATREGGKGQTVWGEGFWGGTEELEAKMHVRKIMVAGTRTVSRIK